MVRSLTININDDRNAQHTFPWNRLLLANLITKYLSVEGQFPVVYCESNVLPSFFFILRCGLKSDRTFLKIILLRQILTNFVNLYNVLAILDKFFILLLHCQIVSAVPENYSNKKENTYYHIVQTQL